MAQIPAGSGAGPDSASTDDARGSEAFQAWMGNFGRTLGDWNREAPMPPEPCVTHSSDAVWLEEDVTGTPARIGVLLGQPARAMEFYLQEILVDGSSDMQRHIHESVHCVIQGSGYSEIGPERFEWGPGDFVYTPPMVWHRHYNTGPDLVRMILFENSAMLGHLGLNRRDSVGLMTYQELVEKNGGKL